MHELSVVFYLIDECEKVAKENNVKHINAVVIELGTVSGIIDSYLVDCWNWAVKKHEIMNDAQLKIERIDAITHCQQCGKNYDTLAFGKICPKCHSDDTYLLQGNEFYIKELEAI